MDLPSPRRSAERSAGPLWAWPLVGGLLAGIGAIGLSQLGSTGQEWVSLLWSGDAASATALLQTVATAEMAALTLTFSVTIVALQLASQQFSPRLLREFARDPITKAVMAVFVATLVVSLVTLAQLSADSPVPALAIAATLLMGGASVAAVVAFIAHMLRSLRVDTMMLVVHDDTMRAIDRFYPVYDDPQSPPGEALVRPPHGGRVVMAARSGFVQSTDVAGLVSLAEAHNAVVRVEVRAGDHVVSGTPIATVWSGSETPRAVVVDDGIRAGVGVGYERTLRQDAAFGFRQLEDIAVKAMSPSVNDPVTAAHAVGHMADLLVRLVACRLGPTVHLDQAGVGRVEVPDRDLRYYLDLACGQLRRFASGEPSVLIALLRMLRDTAVAARDDRQREELRRAADLVTAQASDDMAAVDADAVTDMHERVEQALCGDTGAAFADRAGETRSL